MTEPKTPSQELAALTVDRLIEVGLVRAACRAQMIEKIASGEINSSDWRLEIELATESTNT